MSSVTNLLAGLVKVSFTTFFVNDLAANILEPGMWLAIGYGVGSYWNDFSNLSSIVGGIFAVSIIMFILFRMQRRMMKKYQNPS
jgi:membrane protein DedA with SNARE-associated domain